MRYKSKAILSLAVILWGGVFFCTGLLFSFDKKMKVTMDDAPVHMEPDRQSSIMATLEKGTLVTLGSSRKFRKDWNYIYFASEKTGCTKSGYILDSSVQKLYRVTKVLTIQGGDEQKQVNPSRTHFRNTRWGMSKEQVMMMEGKPGRRERSEGLDIIRYPQEVLNMDCMIGYVFAENRLVEARYTFFNRHENDNRYIQDYERIKELLIRKYGRPQFEKDLWTNSQYRDIPSKWGKALSSGHLKFHSGWRDSETEILLRLFRGNNNISLVIGYSSLKYKALAKKIKERSLV